MVHFRSIRALAVLAMAIGALSLAAACGGTSAPKAQPTVPSNSVKIPGQAATASGGSANGGAAATAAGGSSNGASATGTKVQIVMTDNVFATKDLKVPAGTPITFEAKNTGAAIHNVHILSQEGEGKDFSSELMVNPGKTSTFQATFTKKGTYKFQCDFHVPDMVGTITVG